MLTNKVMNRTVSIVAALLIFFVSVMSYSSTQTANAVNTSITYKVCDAQTGDYLRSYTISAYSESEPSTANVIGTDDRVIDWTKSGVVKIVMQMNNDTYIGTGFVVDDHVIATAAHCVKGFKISDVLLFDTSGNVTLHATPVEYHYSTAYSTGYKDYALITVKEDLSSYACFDLGVPLDSLTSRTTTTAVSVTGFPVEIEGSDDPVNTATKHMKYTGNGIIAENSIAEGAYSECLSYNADTSGGNSGGPTYITESRNGKTHYTVIAVHIAGNSAQNYGTKITTDILRFYLRNSNIKYE